MKVILTQEVKKVGRKGDIVEVSDGYANNFLFNNKLAIPANQGNLNINAQEKANQAKKIKEETEAAKVLASKLESAVIELSVKMGENGKTFGSVTSKEIAEGLNKQNLNVDKKQIVLKDAIKNAGEYTIEAKLFAGVSAKFKVVVKTV